MYNILSWFWTTLRTLFSWAFCFKCMIMAAWLVTISEIERTGTVFGGAFFLPTFISYPIALPGSLIDHFLSGLGGMNFVANIVHLGFYIAAGEWLAHLFGLRI